MLFFTDKNAPKFEQKIHNLIGEKNAIEELAKKESARILLISDSHRDADLFSDIVKTYGKTCDALSFCGDGTGDLVRMLNRAFSFKEERGFLPPVIAFVQGNGDPSKIDCDFKPYELTVPQRQVLEAAGKKILISHGHLQGVDYDDALFIDEAKMADCQIIFHGHTHIARDVTKENGFKIINPGSPSRPRGGTPPGFAIVTIQGEIVDTAFIKVTGNGFEFYTPWM